MDNSNRVLDDELLHTRKKKETKLSFPLCIVLLGIGIVGVLFKIQHWPGASLMLLLSTGSLTGYLWGKLFFSKGGWYRLKLFAAPLLPQLLLIIKYKYYNIIALLVLSGIISVSAIITILYELWAKKRNN